MLPAGSDGPVALPSATVFVDALAGEARAHFLDGPGRALHAGLAAGLAQRVGRVTADGAVALRMPVDGPDAGDIRANAAQQCQHHGRPRTCP